jgi:hypothetical protein
MMNPKLIVALIAAGVVAFSMTYFRTGDPDIPGLTRPEASLSVYATEDAATVEGATTRPNSRFKQKAAPSKRNGAKARSKPGRTNAQKERAAKARTSRTERDVKKASGMRGSRKSKGRRSRTREEHLEKIRQAKVRGQAEGREFPETSEQHLQDEEIYDEQFDGEQMPEEGMNPEDQEMPLMDEPIID